MEGKKDQIEDLSDQRMRLIVKKDSDTRLRSELIGSQSILTPEEVNNLSRATLVGYVTLLRQLNKSTTSCRNVIDDFDPKQSKINSDDNNDSARSKSVSDDKSREEPISLSGLVQSQVMTQSIGSTTDTLGIVKSIDYLITLQREERIEKERQLKEEKEERERLYDLRERKEKEHKAEKERLQELKENKEKQERIEKENKEKQERIEKENKEKQERIEKEIKEKEEKAEIQRLFDLKEKREKEEREERWRIEREDRIERERIRADKLVEREAKDRKDQLDREQRKIEFEQLLLKDREERELRDKLRDERDAKDRRDRSEELERDRIAREQRYQEEKDERLEKESRRDSRLRRATDNLKGRLSEQPEDLKSMINFFKVFESSFIAYNVDEDLKVSILIPYLNNRSKQLVLALPMGTTFEQVKVAILAEYNFSPRMYRSAFLDAFRSLGESAVQFVTRITNSLELYLDSRGINKDYNRLLELSISDRFRDTLDEETRHYVADHEHDGWMLPKRMAQLIDAYQSERHPNWNYLRNPT